MFKFEEEALLQQIDQHMFIIAYAITKNKNDALDVVQDAWVKIIAKIDTLRNEDKLLPWAKTIAAHTALNAVTRKKDQLMCDMTLERLTATSRTDTSVDDLIMVNDIYEKIGYFDQVTRDIFVYKYYYGYKDEHIADKLQMPVGTIKARIHRKIKSLRQHYASV